jgi:hypothetical protein
MWSQLERDVILGPLLRAIGDRYTDLTSFLCSTHVLATDEALWADFHRILITKQRAFQSLRGPKRWVNAMGHETQDFSCLHTKTPTEEADKLTRFQVIRLAFEIGVMDEVEILLQDRVYVIDQDQMDLYAAVLLPFPGIFSPQAVLDTLAAKQITLCAWEPIIKHSYNLQDQDKITDANSVANAVQLIWKYWRPSCGHMGNGRSSDRISASSTFEDWNAHVASLLWKLMGSGNQEVYLVDAEAKKMNTPMRCMGVYLIVCSQRVIALFQSSEF